MTAQKAEKYGGRNQRHDASGREKRKTLRRPEVLSVVLSQYWIADFDTLFVKVSIFGTIFDTSNHGSVVNGRWGVVDGATRRLHVVPIYRHDREVI